METNHHKMFLLALWTLCSGSQPEGGLPSGEAEERTNLHEDCSLTLTSSRFQTQKLFSLVILSNTEILIETSEMLEELLSHHPYYPI